VGDAGVVVGELEHETQAGRRRQVVGVERDVLRRNVEGGAVTGLLAGTGSAEAGPDVAGAADAANALADGLMSMPAIGSVEVEGAGGA
jgi:hypothetical protein